MGQEEVRFALMPRLDAAAARRLAPELAKLRGQPVTVDADKVEVASGLAFEVLLAAARQWRIDGHALSLRAPSPVFRATARILGLETELPWADPVEATPA